MSIGHKMYALASELFPICRSITGDGVRQTLRIIQLELPQLTIHEVPSGTEAFDWTVPDEWNISSAHLIDPDGDLIVDFSQNNLHVVGYSEPIDTRIDLSDLNDHLFSLPEQPRAIPYVTSYYKNFWGFCLAHEAREKLKPGVYHAKIKSTLEPGSLTYGELIIPGNSKQEVLLSTYICHPSMANNEVSGPVVTTQLVKWLLEQPRRYTYRIVFIPETIGSIVYLSKNIKNMKDNTIAGFNITCVGDDREYSYLPTRHGNTLSDRCAKHVLAHTDPNYITYTWLNRGSDERQYNAPGIDLPVVTVMRSKFGCYPEYHTSLDDLTFITPEGLENGYLVLRRCLETLETNRFYKVTVLGEPQLGKRGLYPNISTNKSVADVKAMINFITYSDGKRDLISIADIIGVPSWKLTSIVDKLCYHGLLETY